MATNSNRVRNRQKVNALVAEVIQIAAILLDRDAWRGVAPQAPLQTLDEVLDHPQTAAVGMLQESADGKFKLIGLPLQFDGERPAFRKNPPVLAGRQRHSFRTRSGATHESLARSKARQEEGITAWTPSIPRP